MSSSRWLNYGISAVGALVVGVTTFGLGLPWYMTAALFTFGAGAAFLNGRFATPSLGGGVMGGAGGFAGARTKSRSDAVSQALQINTNSEAITLPVVFGTQRIGGNFTRYDRNSFRTVPIIQRVRRDPALVAYEQAKKAYKKDPDRVDHAIDDLASKQQEQAGGSGGKGARPSPPPPPSQTLDAYDKVGQYAQILLKEDQTGGRKLPVEYDEFVVGYRYFLSFELAYCLGPVDRFELMRSYPGEQAVIDNTNTPDVTGANSYAFTAKGGDEGGSVRFYPGKANQTRETGDVFKAPETNYRNVAFAMFSNYYLGQAPAVKSYAVEVTRYPKVLDADGNPIPNFPVRGSSAGLVYTATLATWAANKVTVTIGAHGIVPGQRIIAEGWVPKAFNGVNRVVLETTPTTISFTSANPGTISTLGTIRTAHPCYFSANPAAVLWEVFTNKLWGRGINPNDLDLPSFRAAAQYFEANNIGMDFYLETQNLISEAVDTIRTHVYTMVVPVGGILKCICLLDRSNAYNPRIRITSENVIEPEFMRPDWVGTVNEIRATFQNRFNNYQDEIVIAQDDGNLATIGRVNSTRMSLPAFGSRDVADRMVRNIIQQIAQPQAQLKFRMNRFESRLTPGDFLEFVWTEWSAGPTTTYWRVVETEDNDEDGDGIIVSCLEDLYVTPLQGLPETFDPGVPAYEEGIITDDSDVVLGDQSRLQFDAGNMQFAVAEMPFFLSSGERLFLLFANRDTGRINAVNFYARETGSGSDFYYLGQLSPWAIFGELQTELSADDYPSIRRDIYNLTINLEFATDRARLLEIYSFAPTDDDHLVALVGSEQNWMIIGNELFQVGQAEPGAAANQVILTVYLRGQLGTERENHSIGDRVIFVHEFIPRVYTLRYDQLPINVPLDFRAIPLDINGNTGLQYDFTYTITNRARQPMRIEVWDSTGSTSTSWTVDFRPRFHNRGAETIVDIDSDLNTFTAEIPNLYEFFVMPRNSSETDLLSIAARVTPTLIQDDGTDPTTGIASFAYTAPAGTDHLLLYTAFDGVLGLPARINLP
jgi:hypothetical protein